MLPPPPPPRLPPPAPHFSSSQSTASHAPQINKQSTNAPDRNALLSQIRGGTKLKKTVINDRSSPLIQKHQSSASGNSTTTNRPSGLGELFSQRIPKLRPAGNRTNEGNISGFANADANKALNAYSQPFIPSPEAPTNKPSKKQIKATVDNGLDQNKPFNDIISSQSMAKPTPPPSKLKPTFIPDPTTGSSFSKNLLQNKTQFKNPVNAPKAPTKQIFTTQNLTKEDSHASSNKPLSPPKQVQNTIKSGDHVQNKPLPPSKITSSWNTNMSNNPLQCVNIIKENGVVKPSQLDTHSQTSSTSSLTTTDRRNNMPENKGMSTLTINSSTLPVRNHSAPDNLNQLTRHNSLRPPPPPIPPPNRVMQAQPSRQPSQFHNSHLSPQLIMPRSSEPPPLPKSTPPPLPHRSPQTLPRFAPKVQSIAPPLPARTQPKPNNYHIGTQDFESRFKTLFHETQEFPFPHYQITPHKFYMSQAYNKELKGTIGRQVGNHLLVAKAAEC